MHEWAQDTGKWIITHNSVYWILQLQNLTLVSNATSENMTARIQKK